MGVQEFFVLCGDAAAQNGSRGSLSTKDLEFVRDKITAIRSCHHAGLRHLAIRPQKPEPKQMLAEELSKLWVVLEDARTERVPGYGREFSPQGKAVWEKLVQTLLQETALIRGMVLKGRNGA